MSEQYLGEIRVMGFNYPPKGWALCNGQTLPINQNQALFALLGTTYGGNGTTTFLLPNLQSQCAISFGTSAAGNQYTQGQTAGEANHTLIVNEMPNHLHTPLASSSAGTSASPAGNLPATPSTNVYSASASPAVALANSSPAGSSQPHSNMSPYLVLNFCIALVGIFPSRN